MSEHTKEPWSTCEAGGYIYINEAGGAGYVCNLVLHPHRSDEIRANARRIVACVNACAGIETEYLEAMRGTSILTKANASFDAVKVQRDELLAALEVAESILDSETEYVEFKTAREQIRAVIASVKGGAA